LLEVGSANSSTVVVPLPLDILRPFLAATESPTATAPTPALDAERKRAEAERQAEEVKAHVPELAP